MKYHRVVKVLFTFLLAGLTGIMSQKSLNAEEGLVVDEIEKVDINTTVYVKPSTEVAVRRGKGTEFKIIAFVKDGTTVLLLEEDGSYARVRLPNAKEGWMLTRFLSEDPPLEQLVVSLQQENEKVIKREAELRQELGELSEALDTTNSELSITLTEKDSAVEDYAKLERDTADVVKIKSELEDTLKSNEQLTEKLAVVELENDNLSKDKKLYWFLAGGGVLLLGMLLGRMPGPSRKRKSSLM